MKESLLKYFGCSILALFVSMATYAQTGSIKGSVYDDADQSLTGASVILKGTTKGAVADVDGNFLIENVATGTQTVVISFIGFGEEELTLEVSSGQTVDIGKITLLSDAIGLEEIMVIASVAIDRKTPVAVSSIKEATIEAKIGSQEFPEILKSSPGVFATKGGGGYGDGRVNVRGFADDNVAVLINGIPVNDMENGHVYWSNWAGLTDAASSIQVQRGLGASKVAVPSIGGTINILSKASDRKKGGYVQVGTGNNAYSKVGFSLSSGLTDNGWAFTVSGAKTQGDGYIDGTNFLGYSYFTNITKFLNEKHELAFTLVGAKQTHGQRYTGITIEDLDKSSQGRQFNYDWGYRNGQIQNWSYNFYHKPQMSLNHYFTISNKTELSTAVYASFGDGGGRRAQGADFGSGAQGVVRSGGRYGPIDFDYYENMNKNNPSGESINWFSASHNSHKWYGILSSLNHELSDNLKLLAGIDMRSYSGQHYYEITDLLGGDYVIKSDNVDNPNAKLTEGGRHNKDYTGNVLWTGLFAQVEYSLENLSAFVSLSGSNTGYQKEEFMWYSISDPNNTTDKINYLGFQAKGGANYNLSNNHNVFINGGYLSRAPTFDNVFAGGDRSTVVNEDAENETIFTIELGYGLRTANLSGNLNVYRTQWMNRALPQRTPGQDGQMYFANVLGIDATHQGVELDLKYNWNRKLDLTGMLSLQDNTWQNDVEDVVVRDQDGVDIRTYNFYMSGLRVGNAAQTTAALGFDYKLLTGLKVGLDFNYYDNLYADFDPEDAQTKAEAVQSWKVPAYGLLDLNMSYNFEIAGLKSSLYANINNITNTKYVADANSTTWMYSGFGTTWTISAKVRF